MRTDILQLASDLAGRGEAFALATVVRREPPSSARVGDAAVVTADGKFHGWLGGSCTRPTVIREALAALADEGPRLIGIVRDPDSASGARPGLTVFPMACHSGGSVEIYIEPLLPARRLLVFGVTPTARALARLAAELGYRVEAVDPEASEALFPDAGRVVTDDASVEPPGSERDAARCFAVVATLGQRDEEAALAAARLEPAYLGVVASRKRFGQIRETLAAGGATQEQLDRITNPAGLDIGAETPEEIALSILAEITRRGRARRPARDRAPAATVGETEQNPAPAATAAETGLGPGAPVTTAETRQDPAAAVTVAGTGRDPAAAVALPETGQAPTPAAVTTAETGQDPAAAVSVASPGQDPAAAVALPETGQVPTPAAPVADRARDSAAPAPATGRDPVCGMTVSASAASHHAEVGGRTWYFCCARCRAQFVAEPGKYAATAGAEA